jgi:hypothetical protein
MRALSFWEDANAKEAGDRSEFEPVQEAGRASQGKEPDQGRTKDRELYYREPVAVVRY